jgi:hypothetical protein
MHERKKNALNFCNANASDAHFRIFLSINPHTILPRAIIAHALFEASEIPFSQASVHRESVLRLHYLL